MPAWPDRRSVPSAVALDLKDADKTIHGIAISKAILSRLLVSTFICIRLVDVYYFVIHLATTTC